MCVCVRVFPSTACMNVAREANLASSVNQLEWGARLNL